MWRFFETAHGKVEKFRNGRTRQTDADFLAECPLSEPMDREVALGVRRAVAHIGLIDPLLIHASDRFPGELSMLPLWDSMDWLALTFELEYQLDWRITDPITDLWSQASFSVKDLVTATVARRPT